MKIAGKFSRVSKAGFRDGYVLIGLCGDVYPHDLTDCQISHLKTFYFMQQDSTVEILQSWPEEIEPAYPAAKANFKNGFLLITNNTIHGGA